jgi:hypothetical protein
MRTGWTSPLADRSNRGTPQPTVNTATRQMSVNRPTLPTPMRMPIDVPTSLQRKAITLGRLYGVGSQLQLKSLPTRPDP